MPRIGGSIASGGDVQAGSLEADSRHCQYLADIGIVLRLRPRVALTAAGRLVLRNSDAIVRSARQLAAQMGVRTF